jgi:hypothetical protein
MREARTGGRHSSGSERDLGLKGNVGFSFQPDSHFIADDERLITIEDAAQSLVSADDVGEPDRDEEGVPSPHPKASNSRTLRRSVQAQRGEVNAGSE